MFSQKSGRLETYCYGDPPCGHRCDKSVRLGNASVLDNVLQLIENPFGTHAVSCLIPPYLSSPYCCTNCAKAFSRFVAARSTLRVSVRNV